MAKTRGKDFLLQSEDTSGSGTYTTVGGLRATGLTINNEQIDTTSKDGDDWRTLIVSGVQSMSVTGDGVFDNDTVGKAIQLRATTNTLWNYKLIDNTGNTFTGSFQITSWGLSGEYTGALEYTLSLESAGTVTYTPV
jgi:TP901-1 family phage major tail protein